MVNSRFWALWGQILVVLFFMGYAYAADLPYDPLSASSPIKAKTVDLPVHDAARHRDIPTRVYLPAGMSPAPVLLFSHGLGGSREQNVYLGYHWAARGYLVVFLQHPGSDSSVWQGKPVGQRMRAMRQAASAENFVLRVKDVSAVLDQLERWNSDSGHILNKRLDLARIGMAGHSFGAVTTQAVGGQRAARVGGKFIDSHIDAALAMSPSCPRHGTPEEAFGKVSIPWLLMTGTKDTSPIGNADVKCRQAVFPALPPGSKYELVLGGAEHSAFTDRALPGDKEPRNPNHHRAILALSTAFWDAYLRGDASSRAWLDGNGAKSVLERHDRWQTK